MNKRILLIIGMMAIAILVSGCTGISPPSFRNRGGVMTGQTPLKNNQDERDHPNMYIPPSPPKYPGNFRIWLRMKNYLVVEYLIIGAQREWGNFRLVDRVNYGGRVVLKIKSDNTPDYFWMVPLPGEKEGRFETEAQRFQEDSHLGVTIPIPKPPRYVSISVEIRNRRIYNIYINNPQEGWGRFEMQGEVDHETGIARFVNQLFPGKSWRARFKRANGKSTIVAVLDK